MGYFAVGMDLVVLGTIYVLLALALNIQFGFSGLLNFGLVGFFGAGAYTLALLTNPTPGPAAYHSFSLGLNPWIGLIGAGVVGFGLAVLISLCTYRVSGHQVGLATYSLAGIFLEIMGNEQWLSGGEFGILNAPVPNLFGDYTIFIISVVILIIVFFALLRILNSPFGRILKAMNDSELGIESLGRDVSKFKILAFGVGGFVAGIAGALFIWYNGGVVTLTMFPMAVTFEIWMAMLLGGRGRIFSMVIGGAILVLLLHGIKYVPLGAGTLIANFRYVIMGVTIVAIMRFKPEGVTPEGYV